MCDCQYVRNITKITLQPTYHVCEKANYLPFINNKYIISHIFMKSPPLREREYPSCSASNNFFKRFYSSTATNTQVYD